MQVTVNRVEVDRSAVTDWISYLKAQNWVVEESLIETKLLTFGAAQAEVVAQAIKSKWRNLYPLKSVVIHPEMVLPGQKTEKHKQFDLHQFDSQNERSTARWNKLEPTALNSLKKCEAILSRYNVTGDSLNVEKMARLSEVVAGFIRNCDPTDVLGDPNLHVMVRQLFKEAGVRRLKERAAA